MKEKLKRFLWFLGSQIGLDLIKTFRSIRGLSYYVRDFAHFRAGYNGNLELMPCLHDRYEEAGNTMSEYFLQDLFVAQKIFKANPMRHVDIGSRVDGLVAHVASFREIEVFDIRPITNQIINVKFKQADLSRSFEDTVRDYCDSASCLHALEHFGLGRYGDPVDPFSFERGIANMAKMLNEGGTLYLSVPIGQERVQFNAHRVFDPLTIIHEAENWDLSLSNLTLITEDGIVRQSETDDVTLSGLAQVRYALGIFIFTKSHKKVFTNT